MSTPPETAPVTGRRMIRDAVQLHTELVALGIVALLAAVAVVIGVTFIPRPQLGESGAGPGVVTITPTPGSTPTLTTADADAIVSSVPGVVLLSRVVSGTLPVRPASLGMQLAVEAVDPSYALIPGVTLARGTFFSSEDASGASRVAVLGAQAARALFTGVESPIGQTIRLASVPFTVVGVLADGGTGPLAGSTGAVLIPFQSGQVRLFGTTSLGEIVLQSVNGSQTGVIAQQIQRLLRMRHQVRPSQSEGFTVQFVGASRTSGNLADVFTQSLVSQSRQLACAAKTVC